MNLEAQLNRWKKHGDPNIKGLLDAERTKAVYIQFSRETLRRT